MRKMKDSGLEWIGEIPEEWKISKIKYLFTIGKGLNITKEKLVDKGLSVVNYGQIHSKINNMTDIKPELIRYVSELYELFFPKSEVYKHDFIFADTSEDYDGCGNCVYKRDESKLFAGYHTIILHTKTKKDNRFFAYLFITDLWRKQIRELVSGIKVFSISQKLLLNSNIIIPSKKEQQQIADYLDARCAEIDATLEDIQKEINILEDYKKSVITEAVTKGLDPNAEMKDSGIEWIGEIPKEWQIKRFKYVATIEPCLVNPEKYLTYNQIAPDSIEKNTGKLILKRTVEEAAVDSWNHFFHKGQIIYSKIRPVLNKLIIAPYCGLCSADMYPITAKENVQFLYYEMLSNFFVNQVALVTRDRIKMPKINQEELGNILIVLPPSKIQQQIADYLNARCSEIDALIADKKKQLELLADYKKSLIYEYVTGKKEVPTQG